LQGYNNYNNAVRANQTNHIALRNYKFNLAISKSGNEDILKSYIIACNAIS